MDDKFTTYLLEPKSPLVLRTGRPFDQAGDPVSLSFPLPSTTAGAYRTAIGDEKNWDFGKKNDELKEITVLGPLAAIINKDSVKPLFPRPADALYLKTNGTSSIYRLKPGKTTEGEWLNLPRGLQPVFLEDNVKSKPVKGDIWWREENMVNWLLGENLYGIQPDKLGWNGPVPEVRTHVTLTPSTLAAETGNLFQTEGMSFSENNASIDSYTGWKKERYGCIVNVSEKHSIGNTYRRVGGEGRISLIKKIDTIWPSIPENLSTKLKTAESVRVVLATPALLEGGWKPGWIGADMCGNPPGFPGITLCLKAFAGPRWEAVSGWDLKDHKAKAVRRMVPAGTVYWFTVKEGAEQLDKLWLQPISDLQQDRNDGYGIILPGLWEK